MAFVSPSIFFRLFASKRTRATAKQYGVDRFTLMIERKDVLGQEQWHGVYETQFGDNRYSIKNLKVIGTLEKN